MHDEVDTFIRTAARESQNVWWLLESIRTRFPDLPESLIARLIDDTDEVAALAERSFWHPGGFCKIVLKDASTQEYQLRLHVWLNVTDPKRTQDAHSHRWPFASWIVAGSFFQQLLEVAGDGGESMTHYTWQRDCGSQPPRSDELGPVSLKIHTERQLSAGEMYWLPPESVHRFTVQRPGVSLVLQGRATRDHSDVFRPANQDWATQAIPQSMSVNDLRGVLEAAKVLVAREGSA